MEFKKVKLGECVDYILDYRGKTPKKSKTGIPTLSAKSVKNNFIDYDEVYYISRDEYNRFMSKGFPRIGDILMTMEAPLGLVATLDRDDVGLGQRIVTIRGKKDFLDNNYLKFYLQSPKGQHELYSRATGTTVVGISQKNLKNIDIVIPSLENQIRIGRILNNYNIKIEINNKIISNLESQAQAIFKSWFVDFEPFQDGNFVESELGMIPEGWEVKSLSDIAFFKNGLAMQKYRPEINEPSLPVLKIRELNSGSTDFSSDRCRTDIDDSVKVYDGDLIFSWSGTLSCKLWTGGNAGLNQHLFKVTSKKYEKWFNYSWVKFHMNEFIRIAQDKATTMGHIKRSHLDEAKVLIPAIDIYGKIDKLMKPIIELIIKLGIQNTKLAELRDALLPKLMAGEIDVSNIKIEGEEVKNE